MSTTRTIATTLALCTGLLVPSVAFARHGADDPAGDDRGGTTTTATEATETTETTTTATTTSTDEAATPAPARSAKGGRARRATGSCTGSSTAKIKVKRDDGRLETEFEVDEDRVGERWQVVLRRNGRVAVRTSATTRAPSGSFSVERRLADGRGTDTITARATSPDGEVCTARVAI
jgi:hypothetical protein